MSRTATYDRTPPQNIEAERSALGAMLLNPDAIPIVLDAIGETPDAFYVESHGIIYGAIIDLYRDGDPVDMVTLHAALAERGKLEKAGGSAYIGGLTDAVPTSANAPYYAGLVREQHVKRALITTCSRAAGALYNADANTPEVLAALESGIFAVARGKSNTKARHIHDSIPEIRTQLEARLDGEPMPGIRTGYRNLDDIQAPFGPGDYIILAARPSVGKTTLACNLALRVLRAGTPVLFLSLEMTREAIAKKMMSAASGVNIRDIERGRAIKAVEQAKLRRGAEELPRLPLYIDDSPEATSLQIRAKIRDAVKDYGCGLVVIDYLGRIIPPKAENQNVAVSHISRDLKTAAREAEIPLVVLCQLSRQGAESPRLNHLRDSGSLEQDADVVWLLSRSESGGEDSVIVVDIAKQRTGPTCEVKLHFDKAAQQFHDFDPYGRPPERVNTPHRDDDDRDEPFDEFPEEHYQEPETAEIF